MTYSHALDLPAQARVLVITLRRLGDVLLTTPLIRTVRRALPEATLETLVFRGSEGILAGNPDLDSVITMSERPSPRETFGLFRRLWRRYDLVIATQRGDRPTFFALLAGRRRVALVPREGETGAWWKRHAHQVPVAATPDVHRVTQLLSLATAIGLKPVAEVVCPPGRPSESAPRSPYAVLHPGPLYRYKRWNDLGWRQLAHALTERGLAVAVTGGPDAAERGYLDSLWPGADQTVHRLDGQLDWPQLAGLLAAAKVYVGPDTSMTHLAAACGCPTVAVFGPTNPRLIGPWPVGGLAEPWAHGRTVQRRGNVWVIQHPLPCLPCEKLGCEGHLSSRSQCLDDLAAPVVLAAVEQALSHSPRSVISG
jgi:heptosyltransferase III